MTALDFPGFGVFEGGRSASLRGRWILAPGGTAETRPRRAPLALATALAPWRRRSVTMPLLSGALVVNEPVHLTVGEISVAVDKTRSVRLTLAEITALGNRRYAVEVIASALGPDAGPDETVRLEGSAGRVRDGALRLALTGPAPSALIPAPTPRGSGSGPRGASPRGSAYTGPLSPGAVLYGALLHRASAPAPQSPGTPDASVPVDAPPPGALIVSPTRGAGFRLKLTATFAR